MDSCDQPRGSWTYFFFFNDTATTEIYTLSLHDALPILDAPDRHCGKRQHADRDTRPDQVADEGVGEHDYRHRDRSEEHTSELQSPCNLVCRLLLEKKKLTTTPPHHTPVLVHSVTPHERY